jgi:hypothetical protein
MDLKRFSGDTAYLRDEVERLSLLAIQELWMLFPAVLIGAVVNSVRLEHLASYLGASVACALVMRAALQPGPARLFFRLLTVLLLLALPLAGWLRELQPDFQPPLVGWLVACAVALALGRPWLPGAAPAEPVEHPAGEASKVRLNASVLALGLVTVAVLALALRGSLPFPASDPVMARAQSQLAEAFGHQARLLRLNGQALLVGCDLDVGRLSLAAEIVSNHLPDTETRVVSVRTRRWERLGHLFLALTVALFLVFPTYFLTFGAPGPAARPYMGFCALIAGANGAFTVGSALGWFWMNPMPHLAAFLLSASLGWLGLGHARAWVDQQITGLTGAAGAGSSPQRPWPAPGRPTLYDTP